MAKGFAFFNGRGYLLDTTGKLFNSAFEDLNSWPADNFIEAERSFDRGELLARHHDTLVVFGSRTIEFFVDNANPTASPLQRNEIAYRVGIIGDAAQVEDTLYFIGQSDGGDYGLYKLENFNLQKISDERQNYKFEAMATGATDLVLAGFTVNGRHMLSIVQINKTVTISTTTYPVKENLIYDVQYGALLLWTSADTDLDPVAIDSCVSGGLVTHQGTLIQLRPVTATTMEDDPSSAADDDGIPASPVAIAWKLRSQNMTMGSQRRKYLELNWNRGNVWTLTVCSGPCRYRSVLV